MVAQRLNSIVLGSISEILPILLLHSLLPKRTWVDFKNVPILLLVSLLPQPTWVDFSNFAGSVLVQRLVSMRLGRFQ